MRQLAQQVAARKDALPWLDEDRAIDGHMDFGESSQSQVGATRALTEPLAKAHERQGRKAESIAAKLQYHVVALITLYPERIGAVVDNLVTRDRIQVHDLALDRAASRVRTEAVDAHDDSMRLSLQDTLVDEVDLDNPSINRGDNTQRYGRNSPPWIAKYEKQDNEQADGANQPQKVEIAKRDPAQQDRYEQERDALMGDKRISSTLQCSGIPAVKRHATIPCFARRVNTFCPRRDDSG